MSGNVGKVKSEGDGYTRRCHVTLPEGDHATTTKSNVSHNGAGNGGRVHEPIITTSTTNQIGWCNKTSVQLHLMGAKEIVAPNKGGCRRGKKKERKG